MRILALRHGETDWNLHGRMQGHAPVRLNETGREQARRAGRYLAEQYEIDRIVGSDLTRTRETAALVGEHVDAPVAFDRAWRERGIGVYQGLEYAEVRDRFPEFSLTEAALEALDHTPEGGESLVTLADRVTDGWRGLLDDASEETVLLVTHGGPIYVLLGHVKGLDLRDAFLEHSQANCAVNEFHHDGETRLLRENVTEWADSDTLEGGFEGP